MNDTTRRALAEINRRFYSRHAESFSASREKPWLGWNRLLGHLGAPARGALRVLDVGCGNARFASFLAEHRDDRIAYLGVDASPALLEAARQRLAEGADGRVSTRLLRQDLTGKGVEGCLGTSSHHLIALFGILHHIPGRAARADLLARLAPRLAPSGVLAASLWRFDRLPRFAAKVVPWADFNRDSPDPVDPGDLEDGDYLLTWAGDRDTPRYCHLVDEDEISSALAAAGLTCLDRFTADGSAGDLNRYLVYGPPSEVPAVC